MVSRAGERGHALLVAVMLILLVSLAAQLLHSFLTGRLAAVRGEERAVALAAIGDAGLAATLAELAADRGFGGIGERPFGGGTLASVVAPDRPGFVVVNVRARFGGRASTVRAEVALGAGGPRVVRWERRAGSPEAPR